VILCDAGPLIALIDRKQAAHLRCTEVFKAADLPLLTSWPCFVEAMYMVGSRGGWPFQRALWSMINDGLLQMRSMTEPDIRRSQELMAQYQNVPMDLADASLLATAEALGLRQIFTLDSDFRIYRIGGVHAFEIIPADG
jgi:predicted nucleic acid-binding protein